MNHKMLFCLVLALARAATAENNYDKQSLSVALENNGLPLFGTLNGTVTELDTISSQIALNRTEAFLNCSSGFMNIKLGFQRPFFGIVYADFDRNSACKITGNGKQTEFIQLPLKGCGTLQRPTRVFTNNIIVRFHPDLEIDGDEVITVVCRYPPPIVPPPLAPAFIQLPAEEAVRTLQPLKEFEILLIICAIIFLALLLLGIGCSYYCLKRRNIKVVRRKPPSTLGSDITKVSEPLSLFGGLKIPRAHALEDSGSEENAESVGTEYPSDVASEESADDATSAYSDKICALPEDALVARLYEPPMPHFDIQLGVRHEREALSVEHSVSSDSETVLNAQEQYLTTIRERTETNTLEKSEKVRKLRESYVQPPIHARVAVKSHAHVSDIGTDVESVSDYSQTATDIYSEQELEIESRHMSNVALAREEAAGAAAYRTHHVTSAREEGAGAAAYHSHQLASAREEVTGAAVYRSHHRQAYDVQEYDERAVSDYRTARHDVTREYQEHQRASETRDLNNFEVILRIIDADLSDDVSTIFTASEKSVIRVAVHDNVDIQHELKSSHRREDLRVLQEHNVVRRNVEPMKWDVLIRVLSKMETTSQAYSGTSASFYSDDDLVRAERFSQSEAVFAAAASADEYSMYSLGEQSAADRSATEITEYHQHVSKSSYAWRE